jgi:hypothetical protein
LIIDAIDCLLKSFNTNNILQQDFNTALEFRQLTNESLEKLIFNKAYSRAELPTG